MRNRVKSFLLQHGPAERKGFDHWSRAAVEALRHLELGAALRMALDSLLDDLDHQRAQLARLDRALGELARSARHAETVEQLRLARGVGRLTVLSFRLGVLHPQRFRSERRETYGG